MMRIFARFRNRLTRHDPENIEHMHSLSDAFRNNAKRSLRIIQTLCAAGAAEESKFLGDIIVDHGTIDR